MSLNLLKNKITVLRRRVYTLLVIEGVARVVWYILLACVASFCLDYFLHLPHTGRALLLLGFVAFLGSVVVRKVLPWKNSIGDDTLIMALERANPQLQERLISAFQFARLLQDPEYQESPEMSQRVIAEAEQLMPSIRFGGILNWKKVGGFVLLPVCAITVLGVVWQHVATFASLGEIWFTRNVLLRDTSWPRRTYMFVVQGQFSVSPEQPVALEVSGDKLSTLIAWYRPQKTRYALWQQLKLSRPSDMDAGKQKLRATLGRVEEALYLYLDDGERQSSLYEIVPGEKEQARMAGIALRFPDNEIIRERGKSLLIKAAVRGTVPSSAQICHQTPQSEWRDDYMKDHGHGVFSYAFPALSDDLSFYLRGGDDNDKLPLYRVKVLNPPTTESIAAWYRYPAYTRLPPTPAQTPQLGGNFKAVTGSSVTLRITPNIAIQKATIQLGEKEKNGTAISLGNKPPAAELAGSVNDLYGTLPVQENVRGQILLTGENGLQDPAPATIYIRALSDQSPFVQFVAPKQQRLDMTLAGSLPLVGKASDDYGIARIALRYKLNRDETWQEISFTAANNNGEYGNKEIESKYLLEFTKLPVLQNLAADKSGEKNTLLLKLYAEDNNNVSGPGVKESSLLTIDLLSKEELKKTLEQRLQEVQRQLRKLSDQQSQLCEAIQDFAAAQTNFEAGDVMRILQMHFSQKGISRDVSAQGEEVKEILQTADNNELFEPYIRNKVESVRNILLGVANEPVSGTFDGRSATAEKQLLAAYQTVRQDMTKGKGYLESTIEEQKQVIIELQKAIQLLGDREDFNEVIQDLENILDQQRKIQPKLKKLLDDTK
jgi:hypothetical protein